MGQSRKGGRNLVVVLPIVLSIFVGLFLLTWAFSSIADRREENKVFLKGVLPDPSLNGPYKGNDQTSNSWQGKRLDAQSNTGINIFTDGERYKFKTLKAKSLSSNKEVIKLDYNQAGNPLWLRFIVDELVQVAPGAYQGKVYVKLGPAFFTLTYFQLHET